MDFKLVVTNVLCFNQIGPKVLEHEKCVSSYTAKGYSTEETKIGFNSEGTLTTIVTPVTRKKVPNGYYD